MKKLKMERLLGCLLISIPLTLFITFVVLVFAALFKFACN